MLLLSSIAVLICFFASVATVQAQDDTVFIDTMVLYTKRAMCQHAQSYVNLDGNCQRITNGVVEVLTDEEARIQIETEIWMNDVYTDAAFRMSGVNADLRLVHVGLFELDKNREYDDEGYETILAKLISKEKKVDKLTTCHVDIVAYLVDKDYTHSESNIAFDSEKGFFVAPRDAKHQYTFTHAVGHLAGLDDTSAFCRDTRAPFPSTPCFKTLMASQSACTCNDGPGGTPGTDGNYVPRVLYFSSADRNWSNIQLHDATSGGSSSVDRLKAILPERFGRKGRQGKCCSWNPPDIAASNNDMGAAVYYDQDAMCEHANLPAGCAITAENRKAIEDEIFINIHLTNAAFILSRVDAHLTLKHFKEVDSALAMIRQDDPSVVGPGAPSRLDIYDIPRPHFCVEYVGWLEDGEYVHVGSNGGGAGGNRDAYAFDFNRNGKHHYLYTHELGHRFGTGAGEFEHSSHAFYQNNAPCFQSIMGGRGESSCADPDVANDLDYVPRVGLWANADLERSGVLLAGPTPTRPDIEQEAATLAATPCSPYCQLNPGTCADFDDPFLTQDNFCNVIPPLRFLCESRTVDLCCKKDVSEHPLTEFLCDPQLNYIAMKDVEDDLCELYPFICQRLCERYPDLCFVRIPKSLLHEPKKLSRKSKPKKLFQKSNPLYVGISAFPLIIGLVTYLAHKQYTKNARREGPHLLQDNSTAATDDNCGKNIGQQVA